VPGRGEETRILPAGPAAATPPAGAVLDLTDFIEDDAPREGESVAPLAARDPEAAAEFDPVPSDSAPDPDPVALPAPLALPAAEPTEERPLLLTLESEAILSQALDEVAERVRDEQPAEPAKPGSSPLEALVLEALRPSLQSWLDQNLPALVERVLREEVRRLARRIEEA
jgi:cell pole-organizing protein PopZ